ncbi:MAG TPA: short-chain dehydrogenase/reductase, partial [Chloroflexota bacterium]|nr:short-chain dehydrogenase/reductase [Chloroflexota bacterium]
EAAVHAMTQSAYAQPPLSWLGGNADEVARVIERAIRAPRPRTRYLVTPSAWLLIGLRTILPDRLWDACLRLAYPSPGLAA